MKFRVRLLFPFISFLLFVLVSQSSSASTIEEKVNALLEQMTIEEKVGQLNQFSSYTLVTGALKDETNPDERVKLLRNGGVGSVLNVVGVEKIRAMQKIAVEETRLGIPLIFAYDIVHGYRTIFPAPLAESSSWDLGLMERTARIAAIEGSAAGLNWTFAPMVDISRDPRWGRVMEGAGEDPYLVSLIAKARIRGFQGDNLSAPDTLAATAKHFAGYGASLAGRDYNTVDISERSLHETFLPPFKASIDADVKTFMNAFNEYDGVPASGNKYLLREILRGDWNYNGVVVSDWDSFGQMIAFGVAADKKEAAILAIEAGSDIDMEGHVYIEELSELVRDGVVGEKLLDESVARVLALKHELGLFDDPYRYLNEERERTLILPEKHRAVAREASRKSVVLLKNDDSLLPVTAEKYQSIAVIGPLAEAQEDMNAWWHAQGQAEDVVTLLQGLRATAPEGIKISYAKGSEIEKRDEKLLKEAIEIAKKNDLVLMAVGESGDKTGEGSSLVSLDLYPAQKELLKAIHATGTPIAMILMNSRPLTIEWSAEHIPAILEGWHLGTEAGNALADVIYGRYNPSGKLTMTFPRSVGQIPIFYDTKRVSRPKIETQRYTSKYMDSPNTPLFPFGYGLSYTTFEYSDISLDKKSFKSGDSIQASITVRNTGKVAGEEVVQLYIQDLVASVVPSVKKLKGFEKISLQPGEEKEVLFAITEDMLKLLTRDMSYRAEAGEFNLFIGTNSEQYSQTAFAFDE